jgi:hypothetical protein
VALKAAQEGLFTMLNVTPEPDALGVNEYALPTVAVIAGEPEIVGAPPPPPPVPVPPELAEVVMWNSALVAVLTPSDTRMRMSLWVPTFAAAGVPVRLPVVALKAAHDGLLTMVNARVFLAGLVTVGVNE